MNELEYKHILKYKDGPQDVSFVDLQALILEIRTSQNFLHYKADRLKNSSISVIALGILKLVRDLGPSETSVSTRISRRSYQCIKC